MSGAGSGDTPPSAWISYEAAPEEWLLDDGSPPPARVPFRRPRYVAATRTFTGTVVWQPASFHGDRRWECACVPCGARARARRRAG